MEAANEEKTLVDTRTESKLVKISERFSESFPPWGFYF